jgi:hypothetical protein
MKLVIISSSTPAIIIIISLCFAQSVQANTGIVPRLGHDHFLPNLFQFFIDAALYSLRYLQHRKVAHM